MYIIRIHFLPRSHIRFNCVLTKQNSHFYSRYIHLIYKLPYKFSHGTSKRGLRRLRRVVRAIQLLSARASETYRTARGSLAKFIRPARVTHAGTQLFYVIFVFLKLFYEENRSRVSTTTTTPKRARIVHCVLAMFTGAILLPGERWRERERSGAPGCCVNPPRFLFAPQDAAVAPPTSSCAATGSTRILPLLVKLSIFARDNRPPAPRTYNVRGSNSRDMRAQQAEARGQVSTTYNDSVETS